MKTQPAATDEPGRTRELSLAQARRIAISAQRLARPLPPPQGTPPQGTPPQATPGTVNRGHLTRLVKDIGLLQIDSVNVLARAHLMPVFSRLGPYPVSVLEGAAWPARSADRLLVEAWAHEASLIPVGTEPLLRWRQQWYARRPWSRLDAVRQTHPGFLDTVLAVIADQGPLSAGEIERALEAPGRGTSGWWEWSVTKIACEYLFASGAIGVAHRRGFERRYDLIDRVLPAAVRAVPTPAEPDAVRELTALAARSHGVGTVKDLADYYRLPVAGTAAALAELMEDGAVIPVRVEGSTVPWYLHGSATIPRSVGGAALLAPFDPLVWERARTERLFGFHYRIEIYTPAHRRQFGYYVFPLLVGDQLVGRFDLKADRARSTLIVQASWVEDGSDPDLTADAAAVELTRMAGWLDLSEVEIAARGTLFQALATRPGMTRGRPAGQ